MIALLALALLALPADGSPDLVVFAPQVANLEPERAAELATAVVEAFTAIEPTLTIVDPTRAGEALAAAGTPPAAAQSLGGLRYVTTRVIRLDGRVELGMTLYRADGALLDTARVRVDAAAPLAPVVVTLADQVWRHAENRATVIERRADRAAGDHAGATFAERAMVGFRSGVALPLSTELDLDPLMMLHFDARPQWRDWFLMLGGGMALPIEQDGRFSYGALFVRIGSGIYLAEGPWAPYVSLGIEPRVLFSEGSGRIGAAPVFGAGVVLLRDRTFRVMVDLEVAQNLVAIDTTPVSEAAAEAAEEKPGVRPTEIGVTLGFAW